MSLCVSSPPIGLQTEACALLSPPPPPFSAILVNPCHRIAARVHFIDSSRESTSERGGLYRKSPAFHRKPINGRPFHSSALWPRSPMASLGTTQVPKSDEKAKYEEDAKVVHVHTIKEFDDALIAAKSRLVVVEYAASHSANSRKIYPSMVELSLTCQDAVFLLVMGDESDETKELCSRVGIEKVPHFVFYKNKEIIHEEEGIGPDELLGDVLYYGDPDAPILQLHNKQDVEELVAKHAEDGKLLVLDVGLKHCGPCVKAWTMTLLHQLLRIMCGR